MMKKLFLAYLTLFSLGISFSATAENLINDLNAGCSHHHQRHKGPTGPTGPTGATGPTGPTGGLSILAYASGETGLDQTVTANETLQIISIDVDTVPPVGITRLDNFTFQIDISGTYLTNWTVNMQQDPAAGSNSSLCNAQLVIDGFVSTGFISQTQFGTGSPSVIRDSLSGTTIVALSVGDTVQLGFYGQSLVPVDPPNSIILQACTLNLTRIAP